MSPASSAPARIGLVGAGRIGRQHALAVQRSPLLELAAIADPSEPARTAIAGDAPTFETVGQMLAEVALDGVVVAVPSALHVDVVPVLLEAGIPVLCEKPCGLATADVRHLASLARESGVALQVGYWRRFVPSLCALRERILDQESGEVAMLSALQWDGEPPSAAFRDPASSGGILVDMGVHEFDMLRWLTGQEIGEIAGFASDVTWAPPVAGDPETVNLVARMSGGATATVSLARRHPPGDLCRIDVLAGEHVESVTFVEPDEDEPLMLAALQAQVEALVGHGAFAPARVDDAVAALDAATRAAQTLGTPLPAPREVLR